ncbi:LysR family transcriptional regulator [Psychromonas sp. RZ22]|uniref:LysR family transcriptional regulator n=1 Tax=Psychromonas algarum TaxID=2555643 RepID=UPI0010674B52|nr:LysR family transcriptional regulator [Psychromonas sp. RZ22]TEW53742.1 LysR family transcriptional regulator [Psychromonas sp. RZ22]
MNITLKQLHVFITITQEKTLTAASEKLFLSKPAVSMALAELEKQLGHKLFERKNNRLLINEMGRALLPLADEQIERSQAITSLFDNNNFQGKIRIGSSNTVGNHLLPILLAQFRAFKNHHDQSMCIDNSTSIGEQLKDYELDIALVEALLVDKQLHVERWIKDEMVIVANPQHPLINKNLISIHDLNKQAWILREEGSGTRHFFLNHIGKHLTDLNIAFELKSTEAIINCCAADLGIGCMAKTAARHALQDKRVVTLPIDIDMSRDLYLVWHKDKYQSPILKEFIEYCQQWSLPF